MLLQARVHVFPLCIAEARGHGQMVIIEAFERLNAELFLLLLPLLRLLFLLLEELLFVELELHFQVTVLLLVFLLRLLIFGIG